ncbi:hypothetical protein IX53_03885 [Kosmotoga pacifica]|uniref:DUF368 domain-containing protein n=2 Tax=Kosmotoga pacifica TaxID=1330330 RepID=A0A0G2ZDW9_9BACT|nr:hypothetical protein IX53_03885 [Kosmotoga pacifica]
MGIANLIPGVSAGTVALLGGIYDELIRSINNLLSLRFTRHGFKFLLEVVAGIAIGIIGFSNLIELTIEKFPSATYGAFAGLVIGGVPVVFSQSTKKTKWYWLCFIFGVLVVIFLALLGGSADNDVNNVLKHSPARFLYDIFAGMMGASSMILPGVSGAFILLLLGEYHRAIAAINAMDAYIILFMGGGIVLGITFMSKLLNFLLERKRAATFMFLTGLMVGSIPDLLLRPPELVWSQLLAGILFGTMFSLYFSKLGKKMEMKRSHEGTI